MCVILHKLKENKPFTIEEVEKAMEYNSDGFSITTFKDNNYKIIKEIDFDKFYNMYKDMYNNKELDNIEYIIHCRIATNGKVCKENCHPFENNNFILWHNGIISEFSNNKNKVDSQQFLNKYFQDKNIKYETVKKRFSKESSSKFILYNKNTHEIISSDNMIKNNDNNYTSNNYYLYNIYSNNYYYSKYDNNYCDKYYDKYYDDIYNNSYNYDIRKEYEDMIDYISKVDISKMERDELKSYILKLENFICDMDIYI